VNNFPKVPIVAKIMVSTPAKGPGPTATTKMSMTTKLGNTLINDIIHFARLPINLKLKILLEAIIENKNAIKPPINVPR
jgi:hypothetical protein